MRTKILHIYHGTQGSAGLYVDSIYKTLHTANFEQEVIVSYFFPFDYGKKVFFKFTDLASGKKKSRIRIYLRYTELVLGLLYSLCYVVIHRPRIINYSFTSNYLVEILFLKIIKRVGCSTLVVTCHDVIPFANKYSSFDKDIIRRKNVFDICDYLLVHNINSKIDLVEFYSINESKILFHSFPIMDLKHLPVVTSFISKDFMVSTEVYDFCFVGHLRKEKGIDVLIKAWNLFVVEFPNARLLIAGNVPDKSTVIKEINESSNVIFYDSYLTDIEYYKFIKKSKCVILPYNRGTNSGIPSTVLSLDTLLLTSNILMFRNNKLISKHSLFDNLDAEGLCDKMKYIYKLSDDERSEIDIINKIAIENYLINFRDELVRIYSSIN